MSFFFTIKFGEIQIFESAQILPNFVFCLEKNSSFQIILKHVNVFKFIFLCYKLKFFFKQHVHYITYMSKKTHEIFLNINF